MPLSYDFVRDMGHVPMLTPQGAERMFKRMLDATGGVGVGLWADPVIDMNRSPQKDHRGLETYANAYLLDFDDKPSGPYMATYERRWALPPVIKAGPHPVLTLENWPAVRLGLRALTESIWTDYAAEGYPRLALYNKAQVQKATLERGYYPGAWAGFTLSVTDPMYSAADAAKQIENAGYPGAGGDVAAAMTAAGVREGRNPHARKEQTDRIKPYYTFLYEFATGCLESLLTKAPHVLEKRVGGAMMAKFRRRWSTGPPPGLLLPKQSGEAMARQTWGPTFTATPAGKAACSGLATVALEHHPADAASFCADVTNAVAGWDCAYTLGENMRTQEGGGRLMPIVAGNAVEATIVGAHTNVTPRVRPVHIPCYPLSALLKPDVELSTWLFETVLPIAMQVIDPAKLFEIAVTASLVAGLEPPKTQRAVCERFWYYGGMTSHTHPDDLVKKVRAVAQHNRVSEHELMRVAADVNAFDSRITRETLRDVRLTRRRYFCRITKRKFVERAVPRLEDARPVVALGLGRESGLHAVGEKDGVLASGCSDTARVGRETNPASQLAAVHHSTGLHPYEVLCCYILAILNGGDDGALLIAAKRLGLNPRVILARYHAFKTWTGIPDEYDPQFGLYRVGVEVDPATNELFASRVATRAGARLFLRDFGKPPAPHLAVLLAGLVGSFRFVRPARLSRVWLQRTLALLREHGDPAEFEDGVSFISRAFWRIREDDLADEILAWESSDQARIDVAAELAQMGASGVELVADLLARHEGEDPIEALVSLGYAPAVAAAMASRFNEGGRITRSSLIHPNWSVDGAGLSFTEFRSERSGLDEATMLRRLRAAASSVSFHHQT